MKKISLITITLLILSFPTFGDPNGKGIICSWKFGFFPENIFPKGPPRDDGFLFENDHVVHVLIKFKNDRFFLEYTKTSKFSTSETEIRWGNYTLDRKKLLLYFDFGKLTGKTLQPCSVFNKKKFNIKMKELKNDYKKKYLKKLKDNKI